MRKTTLLLMTVVSLLMTSKGHTQTFWDTYTNELASVGTLIFAGGPGNASAEFMAQKQELNAVKDSLLSDTAVPFNQEELEKTAQTLIQVTSDIPSFGEMTIQEQIETTLILLTKEYNNAPAPDKHRVGNLIALTQLYFEELIKSVSKMKEDGVL